MNRIIALIITLCVFFVANAKKKEAKFGYVFFESEKNWVVEDSLIRISVTITSHSYTDKVVATRSFSSDAWVSIEVENMSDEIVYIDLGSSFFLRNKQSQMFWNNSQTVVTNGISTGGSVNLGAATSALGIGGIVGTLANGVSIGGGNSISTSTVTQAERVLRLPPFAEQVFSTQLYRPGMSGLGWKKSCSWKVIDAMTMSNPNIAVGEVVDYTPETSPLKFQIYLKYAVSETFTSTNNIVLPFYVNLLVGTKEWPGQEKSVKEINNYGYDLDKPYITVMFE